ncbi:MAG: DUF4783 domain-containing protein [Bacteroidales bacterium]|nr:DUF4783 domain-containing protein [Bacteroidales bacterium]
MIKKYFVTLIILISFPVVLSAQETVSTQIQKGLKLNNADLIASFFNTQVEMSVLDKEDIFSATQAKNILSNFLSQHKVSSYSLLHSGGKSNAKYYIGNIDTGTGKYRVFYLLKGSGTNYKIHQFRIEKQED